MALGTIPPWLDVSPALFQRAVESGAQAGLGLARLRDASRESALARAQRDAEFNARLAESADEEQANRDLRREALAQQGQIETSRGERQDRLAREGLDIRRGQLGLAGQRIENLQDYRGKNLTLREAMVELAKQRQNPELDEPFATDVPGAPGVKIITDARGHEHVVQPSRLDQIMNMFGGGPGATPATNAPKASVTYDYTPEKGLIRRKGG